MKIDLDHLRTAFVTGAGGQDGSYMCDLLLHQGYIVTGLVRPSGDDRLWRLREALRSPNFKLVRGDILDASLAFHVADGQFDHVYHFAAQSHVQQAFNTAPHTIMVNTVATTRLLDALHTKSPTTKFYFAATSEMFGGQDGEDIADEDYPLSARSPYAASKVAAHLMCRVYRELGMFVVSGISFNHESRRRGENFVTRKLGLGVRNFLTTGKKVTLGNVEARRDWHHAKDTVQGIYLAMNTKYSDEWVFASGVTRSVEYFAAAVCKHFNVAYEDVIEISEVEKRPLDVEYLRGDSSSAERMLGWHRKYSFNDLIEDVCYV